MLENSPTQSYGLIVEEECDFCRTKGFETRLEYATHVCKHMEQISAQILLSIYPLKVENSQIFEGFVDILDHCSEYIPCYAAFDTQADDNFISRSIVKKCGIEIRERPVVDKTVIKSLNKVKIEVIGWAEPRWRTDRKNYRDIRFFVVEEMPDSEMILGVEFFGARAPPSHRAFVLHNDRRRMSSSSLCVLKPPRSRPNADRIIYKVAISKSDCVMKSKSRLPKRTTRRDRQQSERSELGFKRQPDHKAKSR